MDTLYVIGTDHKGFDAGVYLAQRLKSIILYQIFPEDKYKEYFPNIVKHVYMQFALTEIGKNLLGILICGTGQGMCIAANRYKGIRAAPIYNKEMAISAKEHNNANILVFGSNFMSAEDMYHCINTFEAHEFLGGIYKKRLDKIDGA